MPATYDLTALAGQRRLTTRAFEWVFTVDAAEQNLGAGESADFCIVPPGHVVQAVDPILRTPEGAIQTFDVGDEATPNGFVDGGDANGAPDALVAKTGAEAYAAGKLYNTGNTNLRLTAVEAADTFVVDLVVRGYAVDDTP